MERDSLALEYRAATENLLTDLRNVSDDHFALKPSPDVWSVAQVAEHLMRLEGYTATVLRGRVEEAGRDPWKRVGIIRKSFESTTRKYTAQGPIVPDESPGDRKLLERSLESIRGDILTSLNELPLEELCLDFEHGIFGKLTRGEWGWFIALHGERHRGQIARIIEALQSR